MPVFVSMYGTLWCISGSMRDLEVLRVDVREVRELRVVERLQHPLAVHDR